MINENDLNLVNAIDFINQTKVEVDPNAKPEPTEITIEEKRSRRAKISLLISIIVLIVAVIAMMVIVVRDIYIYAFNIKKTWFCKYRIFVPAPFAHTIYHMVHIV